MKYGIRFFAILVLASWAVTGSAAAASDDAGAVEGDYDRMFTVGAAIGRYPNQPNDKGTNSQFFRLSWVKQKRHDFRIRGGRHHLLGDTDWGFGASVGKFLPGNSKATFGLSTSTGEQAPQWTASTSFRKTVNKIPITFGYLHDHWESGARNDRFSLGAQRWFRHVILEGAARYNRNEFANLSDSGWGGTIGITYYVWKDLYIGGGHNFGKVRYFPAVLNPTLVEYDAKGYYLTFSKWFQKRMGVNVRLSHAEEPEHNGLRFAWFTEW